MGLYRSTLTITLPSCTACSDLHTLASLRNLHTLSLHVSPHSTRATLDTDSVSSAGVQCLVTSLTSLQQLSLPHCAIVPQGLAQFRGFVHLLTLDLSESQWLDDGCLAAAAVGWKNLERLNISGCRLVSDLGLMVVAAACRHLKDLNISRCAHGISSAGVQKLTALTRLTRLSLAECDRVTSDAVAAIAAAQLPLQHLDLSGCSQVTDMAVAAIGRRLQRLQHLWLSYCCQVTNLGVRHLLQLSELEELDLIGTLYKQTPAIEELHMRVERVHYEDNSGLLWLL